MCEICVRHAVRVERRVVPQFFLPMPRAGVSNLFPGITPPRSRGLRRGRIISRGDATVPARFREKNLRTDKIDRPAASIRVEAGASGMCEICVRHAVRVERRVVPQFFCPCRGQASVISSHGDHAAPVKRMCRGRISHHFSGGETQGIRLPKSPSITDLCRLAPFMQKLEERDDQLGGAA